MTYDFCGIGNAGIDIIARVDEGFLLDWDFPKSICTYLDLETADALEAALPSPQYIPGGCSANTAAGVAALGGNACFIGRMADDAIGRRFLDDLKERGIAYSGTPDPAAGRGSTRIFTLVTADAERTFASYHGVQEDLSENDFDETFLRNSKFLCMDGYALTAGRSGEAFLKAAFISKVAGNIAVFSPNDLSILTTYADMVSALMQISSAILCNAQEAMHIAGSHNLPDVLRHMAGRFPLGAVTAGEAGVYAFQNGEVFHVPAATPPGPVMDTNGAGDAFASGFLLGLSRKYRIEDAASLGNRCAAAIITHAGARPVHDLKLYTTG